MRLILVGSLLVTALPVLAQQPPSATANTTTTPATARAKPKLICEEEEETGSRLGGHKVCMTADQWRQHRHDSQDATSQAQRTPHS